MPRRGPYRERKKKGGEEERRTPLAKYLVSVRIEKGLTQGEIAAKLSRTKGSICRIENGDRQQKCLQGYILYRLAKAYGVPLGEVLKRADWPQLLLIDTNLMDTNEEERQEIIRYLKENL